MNKVEGIKIYVNRNLETLGFALFDNLKTRVHHIIYRKIFATKFLTRLNYMNLFEELFVILI